MLEQHRLFERTSAQALASFINSGLGMLAPQGTLANASQPSGTFQVDPSWIWGYLFTNVEWKVQCPTPSPTLRWTEGQGFSDARFLFRGLIFQQSGFEERLARSELAGSAATEDGIIKNLRKLVNSGAITEARQSIRVAMEQKSESTRLNEWSKLLEPPRVRVVAEQKTPSKEKEYEWLRLHADEHEGQWLAIYDKRLIVASEELTEVLHTVESEGLAEAVLLHFQPKKL